MNDTIKKLDDVKCDFWTLYKFHEDSFRDIDAKARYWLTVSLPALIGLAGYLLEKYEALSVATTSLITAAMVVIALSILAFAATIRSSYVLSGVLAPPNRDIGGLDYFIENDENWLELKRDQLQELLRAIHNNESETNKKAKFLGLAETLLFVGLPAAAFLAASAAFAYTTTSPVWLGSLRIPLPAGPSIGIACGLLVCIAIVCTVHRRYLSSKAKKCK